MAFLPQADNFQSWCGVIVGAGAVFQAQTEASSVERPVSSEMAETHQRLLLYSSVKDCSKYNIKELLLSWSYEVLWHYLLFKLKFKAAGMQNIYRCVINLIGGKLKRENNKY